MQVMYKKGKSNVLLEGIGRVEFNAVEVACYQHGKFISSTSDGYSKKLWLIPLSKLVSITDSKRSIKPGKRERVIEEESV